MAANFMTDNDDVINYEKFLEIWKDADEDLPDYSLTGRMVSNGNYRR